MNDDELQRARREQQHRNTQEYVKCGNPQCGRDWHGQPRKNCPGSHHYDNWKEQEHS